MDEVIDKFLEDLRDILQKPTTQPQDSQKNESVEGTFVTSTYLF